MPEKPLEKEEISRSGIKRMTNKRVWAIRNQYREWLEMGEEAPTQKYLELADLYNVSVGTISNVIRGKGAYKGI